MISQISFHPGTSIKRAAASVLKTLQTPAMASEGFHWLESTMYEHEVNLLQRFLVDTGCAGGSWVFCPAASAHGANDGFSLTSAWLLDVADCVLNMLYIDQLSVACLDR